MRRLRNTKSKSTRGVSLEFVQNGSLDILEGKITELLGALQEATSENAHLRNRMKELGMPEKDKTLEEKENIIRRQQIMLKSKEAAFLELQDAFSEQRRQIEALTSGGGGSKAAEARSSEDSPDVQPLSDGTRDRIRNRLEAVMRKLDQLEKMIQ